ncbi:hypothetical protein L1887_56918 [Cichorium endivia]|nr:hypothetical protein L1887_56918 [Cichorium endivia]
MYKTDVILDAVSVQVHDKTAFDMRGLSRRSTVEGKQKEPNANPEIWAAQRFWLIRQAVEVLRDGRRAISAATVLDVKRKKAEGSPHACTSVMQNGDVQSGDGRLSAPLTLLLLASCFLLLASCFLLLASCFLQLRPPFSGLTPVSLSYFVTKNCLQWITSGARATTTSNLRLPCRANSARIGGVPYRSVRVASFDPAEPRFGRLAAIDGRQCDQRAVCG